MAEGVEIDGVGHGAGWGGKETFVRYDDEGTEDERVLDEQERKKRARNDRRNERRRLARKLKREARNAMAKAVAEGDVELVGEDDALAIEGLFNLANSTGEHAHNAGAHRDSSVSPRKNRRKRKKKKAEDETTHARASAGADATQKTKKKRKRTKWKLDANNIPRLPGGADIDLQLLKKTVMENGGYHRCCELKMWRAVAEKFPMPPGCLNLAAGKLKHVYALLYMPKGSSQRIDPQTTMLRKNSTQRVRQRTVVEEQDVEGEEEDDYDENNHDDDEAEDDEDEDNDGMDDDGQYRNGKVRMSVAAGGERRSTRKRKMKTFDDDFITLDVGPIALNKGRSVTVDDAYRLSTPSRGLPFLDSDLEEEEEIDDDEEDDDEEEEEDEDEEEEEDEEEAHYMTGSDISEDDELRETALVPVMPSRGWSGFDDEAMTEAVAAECKNLKMAKIDAKSGQWPNPRPYWRKDRGHYQNAQEAPVVYPTEEEFENPHEYILSIRELGKEHGMVRVVPPNSFGSPPFGVDVSPFMFHFGTRWQALHKIQHPGLPDSFSDRQKRIEDRMLAFHTGDDHVNLTMMHDLSAAFEAEYFGDSWMKTDAFSVVQWHGCQRSKACAKLNRHTGACNTFVDLTTPKNDLNIRKLEAEFWRIVEDPSEEVYVLYGADIDTTRSSAAGAGFPLTRKRSKFTSYYRKHVVAKEEQTDVHEKSQDTDALVENPSAGEEPEGGKVPVEEEEPSAMNALAKEAEEDAANVRSERADNPPEDVEKEMSEQQQEEKDDEEEKGNEEKKEQEEKGDEEKDEQKEKGDEEKKEQEEKGDEEEENDRLEITQEMPVRFELPESATPVVQTQEAMVDVNAEPAVTIQVAADLSPNAADKAQDAVKVTTSADAMEEYPVSTEKAVCPPASNTVQGNRSNPVKSYRYSRWNPHSLAREKSSLLKHVYNGGEEIPGLTKPYLYVGTILSAFGWHTEDHHLYSVNYHHFGAPKVWYSVPCDEADLFERAVRLELHPSLSSQSNILYQLGTILSPEKLAKHGVHVRTTVQRPGEFIVTYPRGYHSGFNAGFNCCEAVNLACKDWLKSGWNAMCEYRRNRRGVSFSMEQVLLSIVCNAMNFVSSKPVFWTSSSYSGPGRPSSQKPVIGAEWAELLTDAQKLMIKSALVMDMTKYAKKYDVSNERDFVEDWAVVKEACDMLAHIADREKELWDAADATARSCGRMLQPVFLDPDNMGKSIASFIDDKDCVECNRDLFLSAAVCSACSKSTCGLCLDSKNFCSCDAPIKFIFRMTPKELRKLAENMGHIASLFIKLQNGETCDDDEIDADVAEGDTNGNVEDETAVEKENHDGTNNAEERHEEPRHEVAARPEEEM